MKKVFNVHFSTSQPDKTEVKYFVAETVAQVLNYIPIEDMHSVVGVSVGPVVEVIDLL